MKNAWNKRKTRLEHDNAIAGWAMSIMPEIRTDVNERMTGEHRNAIERVVLRLHSKPCPNPTRGVDTWNDSKIIDKFWDEYKCFNSKTDMFNNAGRWNSPDVRAGKSHTWHEKYSCPHTSVLGYVASRCTSYALGIEPSERSWGDVKHIKTGKRSHMSAAATEKRSILYTTARVTESRIRRSAHEQLGSEGTNAVFGDDDMK